MPILANYHTHTARCHHAFGTEREYIEAALSIGMKTLGFADHVPYAFPGGYVSSFRMEQEKTQEYVRTLLALREEYRGRIEILIGFEAEYYPALFAENLRFLQQFPIDYLILGQHLTKNEYDGFYVGAPFSDGATLHAWVDQVTEGLSTGCFSYLAHPDLPQFCGEDAVYCAEMERLCRFCAAEYIPLEINLLGLRGGRCYPSERFFRLAAKAGAKAVIGCDAHEIGFLRDTDGIEACLALARRCGIPVLETVPLRDPFALFKSQSR